MFSITFSFYSASSEVCFVEIIGILRIYGFYRFYVHTKWAVLIWSSDSIGLHCDLPFNQPRISDELFPFPI